MQYNKKKKRHLRYNCIRKKLYQMAQENIPSLFCNDIQKMSLKFSILHTADVASRLYTVAMTVIKLYLILTGCTAYSSPEGRHKQCRHSRKASGYNSATAPSTVFQLPITKPYSMSSSSSNLNTPLCGSCRFHGTYLNKRAKTDLKK